MDVQVSTISRRIADLDDLGVSLLRSSRRRPHSRRLRHITSSHDVSQVVCFVEQNRRERPCHSEPAQFAEQPFVTPPGEGPSQTSCVECTIYHDVERDSVTGQVQAGGKASH
ncbi:hypothetical protein [Mesorhizobium sp. B4-1-4]|uniref:hypothetical protein n=1 Tax=Mesorhizobium sp. B4-1-4 TaxID=2589888 RepID=UPI0039AF17C2